MNWSNLVLFIRSFSVSAFIGIVYLILLEITQLILGYETALFHSLVVLSLYLIGVYFNYILQKKIVFNSNREAVKQFFAYNFFSAGLVSLLSSFFYGDATVQLFFGQWIEAASTAFSLLIVSPISFLFFRLLFRSKKS